MSGLRRLVIQPAHRLHSMFSRMGQLEKAQGKRLNVDFLYTHPTSDNRIKVWSAPLDPRSLINRFPLFSDAASFNTRSAFDSGQQSDVHWDARAI